MEGKTGVASRVVITFMDGSTKTLVGIMDDEPTKMFTSASHMEKVNALPYMAFQLPDCVLMIPRSSIKYIRLYPSPPKAPEDMMPNMQEVDE